MQFGLSMFLTDETIAPVGARARRRGRRLRRDLRPRAHAHPRQPRERVAGRRRAAARVLAHARPVRVAQRDRRHHRAPARSAPASRLIVERDPITLAHEAASLDHLSGGRFELGIGAGWNLEEMRNHGTDPARALRGHARARAGHARDLDPRRGLLPRRVRRLRSHLVMAQAGAEPAAGVGRRHRPARARPRARVRRRLVSEHARPRRARRPRRRAAAARRRRRPRAHPDHLLRPARRRRREAREDGARPASTACCSCSRRPAPTRPCRAWSATPSSPRATADGRGALPRAPVGGARRPPGHRASRRPPARRRLLLRAAGRSRVDGGRRQAEGDHRGCSAWPTSAPTRGRACSSTTTRRTGTRCGGCASTARRRCSSTATSTRRRWPRWSRSTAQYAAAPPRGAVIAVAVERWRGWSAR